MRCKYSARGGEFCRALTFRLRYNNGAELKPFPFRYHLLYGRGYGPPGRS